MPISPALSPWGRLFPWPSWPKVLRPQHFTSSEVMTAHGVIPGGGHAEDESRHQGRSASRASPISPGSSPRASVSPWPSWPTLFVAPALDGVVVEDRAGVAESGADRSGGAAGAEVDRGQGVTHLAGLSPRWPVSPWPSWPLVLPPQHFAVPSSRIAQVWARPAAIATVGAAGAEVHRRAGCRPSRRVRLRCCRCGRVRARRQLS